MATIVAVRRDLGQTVIGQCMSERCGIPDIGEAARLCGHVLRRSSAFLFVRVRFGLFCVVGCNGSGLPFVRPRLLQAKRNIGKLKETRAVGHAARTVFPRALAGRPFQAVTRSNPKLFRIDRLFYRSLASWESLHWIDLPLRPGPVFGFRMSTTVSSKCPGLSAESNE